MNFSQSTGIVYDRIRELEPKIAGKIIGVLLMLDYGEREMIRLAFGPNRMIEEVVQEARVHLQGGSRTMNTTVSPTISSSPPNNADKYTPLTSCNATLVGGGFSSVAVPAITYWTPDQLRQQLRDHQQQVVLNCNSSSCNVGAAVDHDYDPQVQEGNRGGSNGFSGECFYSEATVRSTYANRRTTTCRSLSLQPNNNNNNFSTKICHYYSKGFCKHGSNCRYMHSNSTSNSHGSTGGGGRNGGHNNKIQDTTFIEVIAAANKFNNGGGEDHHHHHHHHGFTQGTLDKLEAEIIELLKSTRGNPISIASLPMVYQEKYGRSLQAEGYLTESQRHGRSGYSLTKLLARLKSIRLFDRPHGQHFVILAEDASKYSLESYNERKDPGPIVAGSRQIYLTFPAESTFSEEDVSNYFSFFGKVEDVRIPNQDKRMFGFVTFSSSSTVRMILGKGNPHFVCGARVLVKPYREKPKLCERKYMTKNESHLYQHHQGGNNNWDFDHEAYRTRRRCEAPRFWRRHLLEEQEWALELDRRRLSELKLARKPFMATVPLHHSVNHSKEQLNPPKEEVNHLLDVFSNGSTSSDDPSTCPGSNCSDQESPVINLPDSPFAYQAAFITAT